VAGIVYYAHDIIPEWKNSILVANLKGRAMRQLELNEKGDLVNRERIYFQKKFGRLRDITVAPNGDIYLATSNQDWHPRLQPFLYDSLPDGSDRILKIQKATPAILAQLENIINPIMLSENPEPLELFDEDWNFTHTEEHLVEGQKL
jgi:hypothetical protein